MRLFKLGFFLLIVFTISDAHAQSLEIKVDTLCSFSEINGFQPCEGGITLNTLELSDGDTLKKIIFHTMDQLGIMRRPYFGKIIGSDLLGVFFKLKQDNLPRILINTDKVPDHWSALAILFHELGHFVNDHENFCSNVELELDADYFSGYCMSKAGANIEEVLYCLSYTTDVSDNSHPSKNDRKLKLLKGWNDEKNSTGIFSFTSINPIVLWKSNGEEVNVTINEIGYRFPFSKYLIETNEIVFDPEFGMLYVKKSKSTYQLANYAKGSKGIGNLVNDRTTVVYLRYSETAFRYFSKGRIIKKDQTMDHHWKDNQTNDYWVKFKEGNVTREMIFQNYGYAPFKRIMPAYYK
jgi:hypothetical protein